MEKQLVLRRVSFRSMPVMIGFILIMVLLLNGSVFAQPVLPLPGTDGRAVVELLSDPGFETDVDNDKIPDAWTGKNTKLKNSDKLKCDTAETAVAHSGTCAFMFRGNPVPPMGKLQQTVTDTSALVNGSAISFSVYVDPRSAPAGTTIGKAKIAYSDGTSTKLVLKIPAAALNLPGSTETRDVADYVPVSASGVVTIPDGGSITKAKVDFRYGQTSGKFFIDDASLTVAPPQPVQLLAADGNDNDDFGAALAVDGDTLVVGAYVEDSQGFNSGAVYVFTRTNGVWTQQQKLFAEDAADHDWFGYSVDVRNDTLVIGAALDDDQGEDSGSVYVYTRSGGVWTFQQKLTLAAGKEKDYFGSSLALNANATSLVIGAGSDTDGNTSAGSVVVFNLDGATWIEGQTLLPSDGQPGDGFGTALALDGDTLVVGAWGYGNNTGRAYVFVRDAGTWSQQQKLIASDAAAGDYFGQSVAILGDTVVVGATGDDDAGEGTGAVYTFTRSGTTWTAQPKLTALNGAADEYFGNAVALSGDRLLVSAYSDDLTGSNQGSAYWFVNTGGSWEQQDKLTATTGNDDAYFGTAVVLAGTTALVGSPDDDVDLNDSQGSVWVFTLP